MKDLIKALTILAKYTDAQWPTHCEHDELFVILDPEIVSEEDQKALEELSFTPCAEGFHSFRFGSC